MANFRMLQPAPTDEESSPPLPQGRPVVAQKPKRTVTLGACVACRRRKSKCDGLRPICTCCTQKDTSCVYELGPNEKPSHAMKRKNEEMQGELLNLRQLYDFLRLRTEQEAMEILRRIRANPPDTDTSPSQRIQELADYMRHGDSSTTKPPSFSTKSPFEHDIGQSVTLPSIRHALESPLSDSPVLPLPGMHSMVLGMDGPPAQRPRHASDADVSARDQGNFTRTSSIAAILDPAPPPRIKAPPTEPRLASVNSWTKVSNDTSLLTSILVSWTLHEYSYYHYLDREIFLDDMASGRIDFCSELLVNALLATACFTSPLVKDRAKPFLASSIMTAFFTEATRLWEVERNQRCLTRIQAGICLYLFLGKHGRDKDGHAFLAEACQIGQELGLFGSPSSTTLSPSSNVPREKLQCVREVTAWALFNFQLNMSFTYSFTTIIQQLPSVAIPYSDRVDAEALFRSECAKHVIVLDCVDAMHFDDKDSGHQIANPHMYKVDACYHRLTTWWKSRPASLTPTKDTSQENLLCSMMYHVNIINLFQPILSSTALQEDTASSLDRARSIISLSLFELRRLLTMQEFRHGWADTITLVLHPLSIASFGSLDDITQAYPDLSDAERSEPYKGLLVCLRALGTLCSYNFYAQPLFRLLTQKCRAMGLRLPSEVQITLDYYMTDDWTKNAANLVSSQYIADMRKTASDVESARMDAIISTWEGMSLDEGGKGKERSDSGGR